MGLLMHDQSQRPYEKRTKTWGRDGLVIKGEEKGSRNLFEETLALSLELQNHSHSTLLSTIATGHPNYFGGQSSLSPVAKKKKNEKRKQNKKKNQGSSRHFKKNSRCGKFRALNLTKKEGIFCRTGNRQKKKRQDRTKAAILINPLFYYIYTTPDFCKD